jgi:hypothetical protein
LGISVDVGVITFLGLRVSGIYAKGLVTALV